MAFAAMVGFLGNGYAIPCRGVDHIKAIVWRTLFFSEANLPPEAKGRATDTWVWCSLILVEPYILVIQLLCK